MRTAAEDVDSLLPDKYNGVDITDIKRVVALAMVDFADSHVRRALDKAQRAARIINEDGSTCSARTVMRRGEKISAEIDKHSITNAYPKSKYIL